MNGESDQTHHAPGDGHWDDAGAAPAPATTLVDLLIVDDDEALRGWTERVVRERGYSCELAANAAEARALMQEREYELVLLDINMPGESGMTLLGEIRREHPWTAVVMVTGEDSLDVALTAIELGAYGYLVKPVGTGELVISVASALHRRRRELGTHRQLDGLRRDIAQRSHMLDEALAELQRSETKLLASQADTVARLARLVEAHDEDTGRHLQRMSSTCELLARRLGSRTRTPNASAWPVSCTTSVRSPYRTASSSSAARSRPTSTTS